MHIPASHANAVRLYGPEFAVDPAGTYRRIRAEHGPVAPALTEGDVPIWVVLGYREVHHVLSSPRIFGRDSRRWNLWDEIPDDWPMRPILSWIPAVIFFEGAEHTRRANAISDALEATDHTDLARICERTADQLINEFVTEGKADLIEQYANQIPIRVLARLYGLPESQVGGMATDLLATTTSDAGALDAFGRIMERMGQLIADHRGTSRSGLTARLVSHPAALSDEELGVDMYVMITLGQQPTADWIGNTLRLMLLDDDFSLTLQGGRSSVDRALNEVLWKDSPIQQMMGRWATQDCELGGQRIRKGDMLGIGVGAANADPQVQPDAFGNGSANRAHMSFACGEHSCPVGAPEIAEVIARTAIEVLLDRIPDVQLAVGEQRLNWKPTATMRGLEALPVVFTPVYAGVRR
ncbi:MAG: cytochrome P450 [Streptosporangiales bacterium]|nr:cytochrome P450 [Streptosporangiales bacterium]